ncbi:MAG: alpha/beta hydrolase [Rhodothalassiaceae bacterium]
MPLIDHLPDGGEALGITAPDGAGLRLMHWRNGGAGRSLLIVPGRTEFIEKYCEVIAELLARGFAVACLDMRNHGRSSRPLADREKHHLLDFAPMIADIDCAVSALESLGYRMPLSILAHSMGGHVALRYAHDHGERLARLVLTAPMVAIRFGAIAPIAKLLIALAIRAGRAQSYALGQHGWQAGKERALLQKLLTSDDARFARETAFLTAEPELRLGGVTWGWLDAARHSTMELLRPGYAQAIATPTLFVLSGADRVVDNDRARRLARVMPNARLVEIAGARHEILMERDDLRARFWTAFDRFFALPEGGD